MTTTEERLKLALTIADNLRKSLVYDVDRLDTMQDIRDLSEELAHTADILNTITKEQQ